MVLAILVMSRITIATKTAAGDKCRALAAKGWCNNHNDRRNMYYQCELECDDICSLELNTTDPSKDCIDKKPCTCAKSYTFDDYLKRNECTSTTNCNKRSARFVQKNCKNSCDICPVNGNWGEWSEYSSCSKTCGRGQKSRSRSCDNPASSRGGADCPGKGEMTTDCNAQPCPVNGNWGEWSKYTPCSNPCGGGQKNRSRSCDKPAPAHGGKDCLGEGEMIKDCNTQPCPVNGNWGCWSDYSLCNQTCGGGQKSRSRSCDNPATAHGGKDCPGKREMTTNCNTQPCPVNGNWGEWSKYTPCSNTCGGGQKNRSRSCDKPAPAHGGADCPGKREMTTDCNTQSCPINGNWGCWSDYYSSCSQTCGGGQKSRSRSCDNPASAHGGADCPGKREMTTDCNTQPCPVNGNWGEWSKYTPCSNTCGGGQKNRSRSCDKPAPAHGGADCPGKRKMTTDCNTQPCPVNGNWGCWSDYSSCNQTCGGGQKNRSRSCDNPAPAHGGADCPGKRKMTTDCNTQACDVDECKTIPAPCNNHGKCTNTDGSYTCDCVCGYTGDRCKTGIYNYTNGDFCYAYVDDKKNWYSAKGYCLSTGGYLAEPKTEAENTFIKNTIWKHTGPVDSMWLGGFSLQEKNGTWTWSRSNAIPIGKFKYWGPTQPSVFTGQKGPQNCMLFWNNVDEMWDNQWCDDGHAFLCQRDK